MRVLFHAPAARVGGARTHLLGLVPELAALAPDARFLLLGQPDVLAALPPLPPTWQLRAERAQDRGFLRRFAWEQLVLPRLAATWRADVLFSLGSFLPLRAPCPTVMEAGNALPFTRAYWELVRKDRPAVQAEWAARFLLLRASLLSAARDLVPTRAMRLDVVATIPRLADRIDVAWWGVGDHFRQVAWHGAGSRVVLGVSKHGVNKEFDVLVAAFARLLERWPDLSLELTGTPDESPWSGETAALAERCGLADRVRWLGDVPNEEVPATMARAAAVVFPTWCESFGLPLAEAMAVGAPTVAGDIPACREVGADGARFYHPGDPADLANQLAAILADEPTARALSVRARERSTLFTWRGNAEGTWAALRHAASLR